MHVTLNANQRRHFEVLFSGLEKSLTTIESGAAVSSQPSELGDANLGNALSVAVRDLPPDFSTNAGPILQRVRRTLHELRTALELTPRPISQRHVFRALVTSEIIRLEESYARGLRGYGEVDPSVAESLDPVLHDMRNDLADVAQLLRGAPREP